MHSYAFRHARLDVLDDAEAVTVAPLLHSGTYITSDASPIESSQRSSMVSSHW